MKVIWSKAALLDLEGIQAYLEQENPPLAWKTIAQLMESAHGLPRFPRRGRSGRAGDSREYIVPRLPYMVIYELRDDIIYIVRILHTARLWPPRNKD